MLVNMELVAFKAFKHYEAMLHQLMLYIMVSFAMELQVINLTKLATVAK